MVVRAIFFLCLSIAIVANDATAYDGTGITCSDPDTWLGANIIVEVEDCRAEEICLLVRGSTKAINITFEAKVDIEGIKPIVNGILADHRFPYPIAEPNGCVNSGLTCPIQKGDSATYQAILPIKTFYPKTKVPVIWELISNGTDEVVACTMIHAQIVDAPSRNN